MARGLMFPDSAISPPIPTSCSSHIEACNALGATDGVTTMRPQVHVRLRVARVIVRLALRSVTSVKDITAKPYLHGVQVLIPPCLSATLCLDRGTRQSHFVLSLRRYVPRLPTQLLLFRSLFLDGERAAPAALNKANKRSQNRICTTRFTVITWLSKSLFFQF